MEIIQKYFNNLNKAQLEQLKGLKELYEAWNAQINVISRKDIDSFYERHVLHSLGIAKVLQLSEGAKVLDVGTGGGFPGVPLAIFYPDAKFILVDSIGKKIKVVDEVVKSLGLKNVEAYHQRAENVNGQFDYVISRAVTHIDKFIPWVKDKIKPGKANQSFGNGIYYLKGGDLEEELQSLRDYLLIDLKNYFEEEFFNTKKVLYVPASSL